MDTPTDSVSSPLPSKKAAKEAVDLAKTIVDAVVGFSAKKDLKRRVNAKHKAMVAKKKGLYGSDALDALLDLAMMPISGNALMNQVKLMAAQRLAPPATAPEHTAGTPNEIDRTLRSLNDDFQKTAPRIRSVRERVIEYEQPARIINGTSS